MILIFDLDDTLYEERQYVLSGFRAVAEFGQDRFGWDAAESFDFMRERLEADGRGAVFNRWLASHGRETKALVRECVRVYRHHTPEIVLKPEARDLLDFYAGDALYLVTDGHKVVQQKKIDALGIESRFRKTYVTHRYGIARAKPSIHCFERIRLREGCQWSEMVYVGDNPAKDFVNLRPLGMHTVRVLTGEHKGREVAAENDAEHRIGNLRELPPLLSRLAG